MAESILNDADVIDRANTVQVIASQHSVERARTRSEKLQDYMIKIDYLSEEVKAKLKDVPFLPVKQRPPNISVPWCGDSCFGASFQMFDKEHMELIFTTGVVADCKSEIYSTLQFRPSPSVEDVIHHLKLCMNGKRTTVHSKKKTELSFPKVCILFMASWTGS